MIQKDLLSKADEVSAIASSSKFARFTSNPLRYILAIGHRMTLYRLSHQSIRVRRKTFFGEKMTLLLPASTDIYLTGGKTHNSEIRLSKFLINHLNQNDIFIDVGAHYGYFSLLASELVGSLGKVIAFEASPATYHILEINAHEKPQIEAFNLAVSNTDGVISFFEFPNLQSEYNSINNIQYQNEIWYKNNEPQEFFIEAVALSTFFKNNSILPTMIKIDVEGAEEKVINGLKAHLINQCPTIIMEFLSDERGNEVHLEAHKILVNFGYNPNTIDQQGEPKPVADISNYLNTYHIESDNIVYIHT